MGRTDAWALQLPEPLPVMPEAVETAKSADPSAQITQMLHASQAKSETPSATTTQCPSCKSSLSGVEQKFERCLSCGKSFAAASNSGSVSVGI